MVLPRARESQQLPLWLRDSHFLDSSAAEVRQQRIAQRVGVVVGDAQ